VTWASLRRDSFAEIQERPLLRRYGPKSYATTWHAACPMWGYWRLGIDAETPNEARRRAMPLILWLLGVPLSLIVILWLIGVV
jgi:hypothetical protein